MIVGKGGVDQGRASELETEARRLEANAEVFARRNDEDHARPLREQAKGLRARALALRGTRPPVKFG
jgi:hypothetical protein